MKEKVNKGWKAEKPKSNLVKVSLSNLILKYSKKWANEFSKHEHEDHTSQIGLDSNKGAHASHAAILNFNEGISFYISDQSVHVVLCCVVWFTKTSNCRLDWLQMIHTIEMGVNSNFTGYPTPLSSSIFSMKQDQE